MQDVYLLEKVFEPDKDRKECIDCECKDSYPIALFKSKEEAEEFAKRYDGNPDRYTITKLPIL